MCNNHKFFHHLKINVKKSFIQAKSNEEILKICLQKNCCKPNKYRNRNCIRYKNGYLRSLKSFFLQNLVNQKIFFSSSCEIFNFESIETYMNLIHGVRFQLFLFCIGLPSLAISLSFTNPPDQKQKKSSRSNQQRFLK